MLARTRGVLSTQNAAHQSRKEQGIDEVGIGRFTGVAVAYVGRLTAVLLAVLAVTFAPAARATGGLQLGFNPDPALVDASNRANGFWIDQARSEGAGIIRLNVDWAQVAPARRPPGFVADNPASAGYDWAAIDSQVRAIESRGLQALINITFAPRWAEGPRRPANVRPGTWRPDPVQFAQFAAAAARRYDGGFPDPADPGAALPRVRYWQAWNEPNLETYLMPQWTRLRHGFAPASPAVYRPMLNAFDAAVKGVAPSNVVLTAGIAPYGNPPGVNFPGGYRMQPLTFDRLLFTSPIHCDVLAQNSYPLGGPLWHVYNPGDVSVADMSQVAGLLRTAMRAGDVLPRGHKQIWMTELGWNSRPPNPGGVPVGRQARWYEQALYVLWRQGVDVVLLLQIVDSAPTPSYAASYQTGIYFADGQPKPAAVAFRFPFVTSRSSFTTVQAWGRAPVAGRLVIERRHHGRWTAIASLAVKQYQVFRKRIALRGAAVLRARVGDQTSLTWSQTR